jgi:hypothetical protein
MPVHIEDDRLETALELFRELQDHIEKADQKVQFVLTANAFLAAGISIDTRSALEQIRLYGLTSSSTTTLILVGLMLLGIVASTVFAVLTLVPRILVTQHTSLLFFADIAIMPPDTFVKDFSSMTQEALYRQILLEIHSNSRIVKEKFRWARSATLTLAACLFFWVGIQMMGFLF